MEHGAISRTRNGTTSYNTIDITQRERGKEGQFARRLYLAARCLLQLDADAVQLAAAVPGARPVQT